MKVTIFAHNTRKRDSFMGFSLPGKCDKWVKHGLRAGVITKIAEKPLHIVTIKTY